MKILSSNLPVSLLHPFSGSSSWEVLMSNGLSVHKASDGQCKPTNLFPTESYLIFRKEIVERVYLILYISTVLSSLRKINKFCIYILQGLKFHDGNNVPLYFWTLKGHKVSKSIKVIIVCIFTDKIWYPWLWFIGSRGENLGFPVHLEGPYLYIHDLASSP